MTTADLWMGSTAFGERADLRRHAVTRRDLIRFGDFEVSAEQPQTEALTEVPGAPALPTITANIGESHVYVDYVRSISAESPLHYVGFCSVPRAESDFDWYRDLRSLREMDNSTAYAATFLMGQPRLVALASTRVDDDGLIGGALILEEAKSLLENAPGEVFYDGMESHLGSKVRRLIRYYGDAAIRALHQAIYTPRSDLEAVEETLRVMGHMDDAQTHHRRLAVLLQELYSPNPRVRDAASIGISLLDDPAAAPSIQRAMDQEPLEQLRRNLQSVLDSLPVPEWHTI